MKSGRRWGRTLGRVTEVGIRTAAARPVSSASLAVFRITFGVAMVLNVALYVPELVGSYYVEPNVLFPYPPFEWVAPPPGAGIYLVYAAMAATGVLIAVGRWYRPATLAFLALHTWVFLLDSTHYQNHEYLISLLALLLALLPADRRWSLDARRRPDRASDTVPAWTVWILRFQIGVPYVFGGIAKLNGDWLRGEPLRMWLAARTEVEPVATILTTDWVVWAMAYGALVLDLTVVGFLSLRRTRVAAFAVVTCFHLMNVWLFGLFIFPWLMIASTLIFFPPDWPERLAAWWDARMAPDPTPSVAGKASAAEAAAARPSAAPSSAGATGVASGRVESSDRAADLRPSAALVAFLAFWVAVQVALPLRHLLIPGDVNWTEEGHRFAWHMKLRDKSGTATFLVTLPDGRVVEVDPRDELSAKQAGSLPGHPRRIVQYAHHLSDRYGGAEVRAETSVSLNGRAPQPIVDPTVDLAAVDPFWVGAADWIEPLVTPLDP